MITEEMKKAFFDKLDQMPLAKKDLKVFGAIRLNIHVTVIGYETAKEWFTALSKLGKVKMVETVLYNKKNKNTCLLPSVHKAYLVACTI